MGYSVGGWDLAGTLFEDGVLGQKGTGFRALLDTVENSRKEKATLECLLWDVIGEPPNSEIDEVGFYSSTHCLVLEARVSAPESLYGTV